MTSALAQDTILFEPLGPRAVARWSRPRRFDFLDRLPTAPVADTELLHLSHYCPTVISLTDEGPLVRILLDPAMLVSAAVDKEGRWRPPYSPMALRSLPFWPGMSPDEIHVASELADDETGERYALRDTTGDPSEQFAIVLAYIDRLRQGMRRLSEAAKLLVAADLLTPLVVREPGMQNVMQTDYFTVSPEKLTALPPARAAALTSDRCLPLDLVTACLFSKRLLARHIALQRIEAFEQQTIEQDFNDFIRPPDLDFRLDGSPLFSFEQFSRLDPAFTEAGS